MEKLIHDIQVHNSVHKFWQSHRGTLATVLTLVFTLCGYYTGNGSSWVSIALFVIAYIIGGHSKAIEGLTTLLKEKELDVDLLMVVAAVGAAAIGYWLDGALLIFIFSLSGTLEEYSMEKTNRDLSAIIKLRPKNATLLRENQQHTVPANDLILDDVVLVKPGERIPVDGIVVDGNSAVNQASITGENLAVDKANGDLAYAGTINGNGALQIKVTKLPEETILAKIIHLVQEAQNEKPPVQQFVERFEGLYAKIVLGLAVLLMFMPHYLLDWSWQLTVYRAMIFLVVASPCALVSSIMPVVLSAISNASRNKVLFKGGVHVENIGTVKVVAFDKTGTLTYGKPEVTDIFSSATLNDDTFLKLIGSAETLSEHPIANAIVGHARTKNIILESPDYFEAQPGFGIHASINGKKYKAGKKNILGNIKLPDEYLFIVQTWEKQGKTVVYMSEEDTVIGVLALRDKIRQNSLRVINELKDMGIRTIMLTGDSKTAAEAVALEIGIDEFYADLLPEDKTKIINSLNVKYGKVAMVGDGVNDAPALAAASVGIAMGTGGTDVAMETADVILMSDEVEKIPFAINLGRRTNRVIKQNLAFATMVVLTLISLNFIGGINLPEGVVGHEGSTVLVILSGLRLLR